MPTVEDLQKDLASANDELKKDLTGISTRLALVEKSAEEMKAKGDKPEAPPEVAKAISELTKQYDDHRVQLGEIQKELVSANEKAIKQANDAYAKAEELEKALQRPGYQFGAAGGETRKSLGAQLVEFLEANRKTFETGRLKAAPEMVLKTFAEEAAFMGATPLEIQKALTTTMTTNFVPVLQQPGYIPLQRRRLRIRDLIPIVSAGTANTVRYLRSVGFTTAGAEAVVSITRTGSVATVTQTGHGYRNFDLVKIIGANQAGYNGNHRITVVDANSYTFAVDSGTVTPATGTITAKRQNNYGAANFVSEGALKPEAEMSFEEKDAKIQVIAHWITLTRQVLDDLPGLRAKVDGELVYGLLRREEQALLYGTGVSPQIPGIMLDPDIQTYSWSQGKLKDTKADAIRRAMTLVDLADFEATGTVIHPTVWEDIELEKGDDGHYIWVRGPEGLGAGQGLWRVPLVVTPAIEADDFLVGAFAFAARLYDREQANVRFADQNEDDFKRNLVLLLAEERMGVAWERPEAFVRGTYDEAPSA